MNKLITLFLLILTPAFGATLCIGPSATGSGSGADWNNLKAWSGTPARGDTWYLVTGSYSGKTINVAVSGTSVITIKKATVADHGGIATGWSDSMGNGQAAFSSSIVINSSYLVFDGVTGPLWSTNSADYGFSIANSPSFPHPLQVYPSGGTKLTTITLSHITSTGTQGDYEHYFMVGLDGSAGTDSLTLSHCFAQFYENHQKASASASQSGWVTEYNIFKNTYSSTSFHGEDINSAYANMSNWTIRYNWFEGTSGYSPTGIIVVLNGPSSGNFLIYGNVFKDKWTTDGQIGGIHYIMHGVCYNNTFVNLHTGSPGNDFHYERWVIPVVSGDAGNDMTVENNLVVAGYGDRGGSGTIDYNGYFATTNTPGVGLEPHQQVLTSNPFINMAGNNLQLRSNTVAGASLGAPYDTDALGNTRSTWTRGAFEFVSGAPVAPSITQQPQGQSLQTGQTISLSVTASGTSPLAYQWNIGGSAVNGATLNSFVKANAQVSDSGSYTVTVTNSAGSITSSVASVTVTNPAVAIIGVNPNSLAFGIVPTNTVTALSFNVQNVGAGTLSGTASASSPFTIASGGTYSLTAGQSQSVTVNFTPTSVGAANSSVSLTGGNGASVGVNGFAYAICATNNILMNAAVIASPMALSSGYAFTTNYGNSPSLDNDYAIVGFSIPNQWTNAILSAPVVATNIGNNSFWVAIDSAPSDPANIWDITNLTTATPAVRTVGWRGSGTDVSPQLPTNIWNLAPGAHYIVINGREPFSQIGTITATLLPNTTQAAPIITSQPQSQVVYVGSPVVFFVTAAGTSPLSFQWNINGTPVPGANQTSYAIASTLPTDAAQYSCTVTNVAGSANSFSATLTVLPSPYAGSPSNTTVIIQ